VYSFVSQRAWITAVVTVLLVLTTMIWLLISLREHSVHFLHEHESGGSVSVREPADEPRGATPSPCARETQPCGTSEIRSHSKFVVWHIALDFDDAPDAFDGNCPYLVGFGGAEGAMLVAIERAIVRGLPVSPELHEILSDYADMDPEVALSRWRDRLAASQTSLAEDPSEVHDFERVVAGINTIIAGDPFDHAWVRDELSTFLHRWPDTELAPVLAWWIVTLSPRVDEQVTSLLHSSRPEIAREAGRAAACTDSLLASMNADDLADLADRISPSDDAALLNIAEHLRLRGAGDGPVMLVGRALRAIRKNPRCAKDYGEGLIESAPDGSIGIGTSITCREVLNANKNVIARDPSFPVPNDLDERELELRRALMRCEDVACGQVTVVRSDGVTLVDATPQAQVALAGCVQGHVEAVAHEAADHRIEVVISGTSACPPSSDLRTHRQLH